MNTTFETIDHDDLGLPPAPAHLTTRLRVELHYDHYAECPLEWDHRSYRSRAVGDDAHPAVRFILFDDSSTLSDYHPFAYPSAVLAHYAAYENARIYKLYWLYGHTGRGSQGASFHTSKDPIRITKTMISAMQEDEDLLSSEHEAIGFVAVDVTQVGNTKRRDNATGRYVPMRTYWSEQASSHADLVERWCNGEFVGFTVEQGELDPDTEEVEDWDHVDSCWGFDDEKYAREEALESARGHWADLLKPSSETPESEVTHAAA